MNKLVKIFPLLTMFVLAGCRGRGGNSSNSTDGSNPSSGNTGGEHSTAGQSSMSQTTNPSSSSGGGGLFYVNFADQTFTNTFHSGDHILNDLGTGGMIDEFVAYVNGLVSGGPLNTISGKNVMSNEDGEGRNHLKIGSKSQYESGELTFTFNLSIVRVELYVQPYYKYYNSTYNPDTSTSITIESQKTSLACSGEVLPKEKKITYSYDTPTHTVSITTDECDGVNGQRVFLNKIGVEVAA